MIQEKYLNLPFGYVVIVGPSGYINNLSDFFDLKCSVQKNNCLANIHIIEKNMEPITVFDTPPKRVLAHVDFAYYKGQMSGQACFVPEKPISAHRIIINEHLHIFETWADTNLTRMCFVRFTRELVRSLCQHRDFSCYHASCVSFADSNRQRRAVAFIGQSGSGKTTFMTEALCALPGASLIANDRVLFGEVDGRRCVVSIPLSVRLIADDAEFEKIRILGEMIGSRCRKERGKVQLSPRLFSAYTRCGMETFCDDFRVILPRNTKIDNTCTFSEANVLASQKRSYNDPAFPDRWLMDNGARSGGYDICEELVVQLPWAYSERSALGQRILEILD